MKHIGRKYVADIGYYLMNEYSGCSFAFPDSQTVEEIELEDTVQKFTDKDFIYGGIIYIKLDDETKKRLISRIYSNDDQIAIILNKDNSAEALQKYNDMQDYRNWYSEIINKLRNA